MKPTAGQEIILWKSDECKSLGDVFNNVANQAVKNTCNTFGKFFKGVVTSYPRLKSRKRSKLSFYNDNIKLKTKDNIVLTEKVGWVKTSKQLLEGVKYTQPRIMHDSKDWYLSVGVKQTVEQPIFINNVIGFDLSVKILEVTLEHTDFNMMNKKKELRKIEKRLQRLQRSVFRKYKMNKEESRYVKTSNILKIENQIRHLRRRLKKIRLHHVLQMTTAIVKTKPCAIVY